MVFSSLSKSMRFSATVTMSAPEAAMASVISSSVRYLPVPTISLDAKDLPAITRSSLMLPPPLARSGWDPIRSRFSGAQEKHRLGSGA